MFRDIDSVFMALATHMTSSCSSFSAACELSSFSLVFLVIVALSAAASCTISISTGCEFYRTTLLITGRICFIDLSNKRAPRRTGTAKSLTILSTTHTQVSLMNTGSIIVSTITTVWFVTLCSRSFCLKRTKLNKANSTMSLRSRFGFVPMSKTQFTRRKRD